MIKSRWVRDDRRGGESVGLYSSEPTNEVGAIEVPVTSDRQPTRAGVAVDLSAQGSGLRATPSLRATGGERRWFVLERPRRDTNGGSEKGSEMMMKIEGKRKTAFPAI